MLTWIALLRGTNVGGNNILPMEALSDCLQDLGLQNVRTYIQSGNCVFQHGETAAPLLAKLIADHLQDRFDFRPHVAALTAAEIKSVIGQNPFSERSNEPKSLHTFFLSKPANNPHINALEKIRKASERFELIDPVFYLYAPDGIGHSKLAAAVEKHPDVPVTSRHLRSVMAILSWLVDYAILH